MVVLAQKEIHHRLPTPGCRQSWTDWGADNALPTQEVERRYDRNAAYRSSLRPFLEVFTTGIFSQTITLLSVASYLSFNMVLEKRSVSPMDQC